MAQRVRTIFTDDLDGWQAAETVSFSLDGQDYVVDLNQEHAEELRGIARQYGQSARRTNSGSGRRRSRQPKAQASAPAQLGPDVQDQDVDPKQVRQWAQEQGHKVSARGRVPGTSVAKFLEAVRR